MKKSRDVPQEESNNSRPHSVRWELWMLLQLGTTGGTGVAGKSVSLLTKQQQKCKQDCTEENANEKSWIGKKRTERILRLIGWEPGANPIKKILYVSWLV